MMAVFEELVAPAAARFQPDIILVGGKAELCRCLKNCLVALPCTRH